ncbi:MAG: DUF4080 domain-containing protein [Clostridia bacterium]|nr:DUF4080 domain-containing protein [Clostridia bacterium]
MKITLLSINSKYIHSSLALWYLTAACEGIGKVTPLEHSINEPSSKILQSVYESHPDFLCICCYIWNIDIALRLCREIKLLLPNLKIVLGGPEVSFRGEEILKDASEIDAVILGEGEVSLPAFLRGDLPNGVIYRDGDRIIKQGDYQCIEDLDSLPSPYTPQMMESLRGKLAYFESSRGCPFSCAYCLSSATKGVRTFSMERVKSDLLKLVSSDVQTIKFVDRTFNCDKNRAKEIVRFLLSIEQDTTFHFEVGADLFDDELLTLLKSAPVGKFQIEAGIQSTNEETLASVCRKTDTAKALDAISEIVSWGNIHVHADLICGLPHEGLESFERSFNDLFATRPHALQVGFLKLLHGSALRDNFGGKFSPFAPYQVLETDSLSADDLFFLQNFENSVELFYNSGRFTCTVNYLTTVFTSPFRLFAHLAEKVSTKPSFSPDNLFALLSALDKDGIDRKRLYASLAFDYLCSFKSRHLPEFLQEPRDAFHLIENGKIAAFSHIPVKVLLKTIAVKEFPFDMQSPALPAIPRTYIFSRKDRCKITGRFKFFVA